jgi:hypothetical protein
MFSDTFTGIAPGSVPLFLGMQAVGGVLAVGLVLALYPDAAEARSRLRGRPQAARRDASAPS